MKEPFSDLLKESQIFRNRSALSPSFIPDHLLFRDKQIDSIVKVLTPSLKGDKGRNLFIYGKTGTGKTSCMKYVLEKVRNISTVRAKISYINCKLHNSRYRVLNKILGDHLPAYAKHGYGTVDIYGKIINWIEEDSKILIAVLDEIDMVTDLDDLVYTLTRANNDMKSGGIVVVGICNNVSFKEKLDPRSLSSLYESELIFPPYNSNELSEILKQRAELGFRKEVIDNSAISLAAAISAKDSGDARLALMMLANAGELAEERAEKKITIEDVRAASKNAEEGIAYELVNTLPEHQRLIIYAIAMLTLQGSRYKKLVQGEDTYLFSGEVYDKYVAIINSLKKDPKSSRWYRKYITDLEMQGLVATYESGKGIRGHTKLIKLLYPPDKIKATIEKGLFNESEAEVKG